MSGLLNAWWMSQPPFAPLLCEPLIRQCVAHLELLPPGSLLVDIGCGDAHMVRALERASYRAIGVDVDVEALKDSVSMSDVIAAEGEHLPLKTESVDGVFAFSAFQYMRREMVLHECHRILKKGGRFAVVENLAGNPLAKLDRARRRLSDVLDSADVRPRHHLPWNERSIYGRLFSELTYEAHHVVAPAFLLSRTIQQASDPALRRNFVAVCLRAVQRVERAVLNVPGVAAIAWHAVICGRK